MTKPFSIDPSWKPKQCVSNLPLLRYLSGGSIPVPQNIEFYFVRGLVMECSLMLLHIILLQMCSFDGSLMSSATTMNLPPAAAVTTTPLYNSNMKPTRLSPDERPIILPPHHRNPTNLAGAAVMRQKTSVTTSDESSQIMIRRYVQSKSLLKK